MTSIPEFAPGCYGSAIAYDSAAPICSVCKFAVECRPLHETNLDLLRDRLGVTVRKRKKIIDRDDVSAETTIPTKVQELADRIEKAGIKVTEKLSAGENPFNGSSFAFMRVAAHILLRSNRAMTRNSLSEAFQYALKWQKNTADAHARIAIQTFIHIGAVDQADGAITLRK